MHTGTASQQPDTCTMNYVHFLVAGKRVIASIKKSHLNFLKRLAQLPVYPSLPTINKDSSLDSSDCVADTPTRHTPNGKLEMDGSPLFRLCYHLNLNVSMHIMHGPKIYDTRHKRFPHYVLDSYLE